MSLILTSRERTKQPQGAVRPSQALNGSGLLLDLSRRYPVDAAGRTAITYRSGGATVSNEATKVGRSLRFASQPTGNPASTAHVSVGPVVPLSGPFTLFFYGRPSSFVNDGSIYITGAISAYQSDGSGAGPFLRWGQGLSFATQKQLVGGIKIGATDYTITEAVDCVEGVDYFLCLVYDGAALRLYKNGVQVASTAASGTVDVGAYTALVIGSDYVNSSSGASGYYGRGFSGDLYLAGAVARAWSAGEAFANARNPWQLFAPQRTARIYSFPTGSGTTVSVPAGAITLTGYAPTVSFTAHQTIAVPKGALVLSAFAPTVSTSAAQTITVPLASLTLTGFAPTVAATAHQTISVPAASLTLTAYAPTVYTTAVTSIAVPKGTLTLTGYAPTINYTTNATIGVPAGSLTLTGYAPTVIGGTSSVWTQVSAASGTWTPQ